MNLQKDGRDVARRHACSMRGVPAIVSMPFSRGDRVSVLAAIDIHGFMAWDSTHGAFDRSKFHGVFRDKIAPLINPWPLPRYKNTKSVIDILICFC
jgi:hypothetical protein